MAEEHNPPVKELLALLNSYKAIDTSNPSSWFVWSDNDGIPPKIQLNYVCHANMRFHVPGYDHLVTACPISDVLAIKYIRMLIHGPFKSFSDLITLRKVKGDYYIQVDGLDKWPANVLFNFCIASRAPVEYPQFIEYWAELTNSGWPELFAFLLSYSTGGAPFKKEREFPCHNHFWFDPAAEWSRILAGTPDLSAKSFKELPLAILPTNSIWGKSDVHYKLSHLTDNKVGEFFDIKPYVKPEAPERRTVNKEGFQKVYWNNGGIHQAPPPLAGGIHDEVAVLEPNVALANHWAQVIAQQDAHNLEEAQANGPMMNFIQAAPPQQPPQPVVWLADEDDNHDDDLNYPDFDEDLADD